MTAAEIAEQIRKAEKREANYIRLLKQSAFDLSDRIGALARRLDDKPAAHISHLGYVKDTGAYIDRMALQIAALRTEIAGLYTLLELKQWREMHEEITNA
jgi:hypothetical protein